MLCILCDFVNKCVSKSTAFAINQRREIICKNHNLKGL